MNPKSALRLAALMVITCSFAACHGASAGPQMQPVNISSFQKATISDPVLNQTAFEVSYPAKWHFQGTIVQGTQCSPIPFPVFRMTSPDGLIVLERMPQLDWSWGNAPGPGDKKDCLPVTRAMSAKELLQYVSATLKVEYVADDPVNPEVLAANQKGLRDSQAGFAAKYAATGMKPPTQTIDMARAVVRYKNGTFMMKGILLGVVNCSTNQIGTGQYGPHWTTASCTATVRYAHAPEAQFQAAVNLMDNKNIGSAINQQWAQQWMDNNSRQTQRNIDTIHRVGAQQMAQSQASHDQFMASQATRQHTHEEFMATMQRGTDMSMHQAAQIANSNHTIASDWVDYSLDRQTVRDPNTGQVNKVSSSYSYTWVDDAGKTSYQTNDVNANPNGSLQGNWTRQTVTHGDGSY